MNTDSVVINLPLIQVEIGLFIQVHIVHKLIMEIFLVQHN